MSRNLPPFVSRFVTVCESVLLQTDYWALSTPTTCTGRAATRFSGLVAVVLVKYPAAPRRAGYCGVHWQWLGIPTQCGSG
eukprot:548794-Rhodomonas_salina.2